MSKVVKPYAGGLYTRARMHSTVVSALRRIRWPVKYKALKQAENGSRLNEKTGKMNKMYKCNECLCSYPAKEVAVDHIDPVVPVDGEWGDTTTFLGTNWNELIPRLLCEEKGLQVLHHMCHDEKTKEEKALRKHYAQLKKQKD